MRSLRFITSLVLGMAACWPAIAALDHERLLEASASVLKIEVTRQHGYSLGSGVVISPERVVTNCHVTRSATRINVMQGDQRWPVETQSSDAVHDLCLLRVPGLGERSIALGHSVDLQHGQRVAAIGFTGGHTMQSSLGQVVGLYPLDGGQVIQSDNGFSSGASGGALLDEQLRLVGILTFRLRGGEHHYFSSPVEWLRPLITESTGETSPRESVDPTESHYWQRQPPAQPIFLQAVALQRDGRWPELEALARRWIETDANATAPWHALAHALEGMGQREAAERARKKISMPTPTDAATPLHKSIQPPIQTSNPVLAEPHVH